MSDTNSNIGYKVNAAAEPQVIEVDYAQDVVAIRERKLYAIFGNYFVFLRREGKPPRYKYYVSVFEAREGEVVNVVRCEAVDAIDIDREEVDGELRRRLKFYIEMWDLMQERQEAEVYLKSKLKMAPQVSDREILAEKIAKLILSENIIKTFITREAGKATVIGIFCYDKYYRECEEELKAKIEACARGFSSLEEKVTRWVINEVLEKVARRTQAEYRPAEHTLLFVDKVFSWRAFIETKDFESALSDPHPDIIVEHRIPWKLNVELWKKVKPGLESYIPPRDWKDIIEIFKRVAPKSYAAFLDWVRKEGEAEGEAERRVVLLLEVIGYTLYPHGYPLHQAVLLVGDGANGKSTYLQLVKTILGRENVASVNLRDLDYRFNRFAAAELYRKLANISAEPVKASNFDATLFKQVTGEDLIRFERKFRDPFYGVNYAKMLFAANELPQVTEETYAFWRRWIVVEFPNRFAEDPSFFEKTFTREEIEGVILCALHAFRLTLERRSFTVEGGKDPRDEWLRRSSSVYRVMKRLMESGIIELDKEGWVVKDDLYSLYSLEAEEGEEEVVTKKRFTEEVERLFSVRSGEVRVGGRHHRVYHGVKIVDWDRAREIVGGLKTPKPLEVGGNTA